MVGHLHVHIITESLTFGFAFGLAFPCQVGNSTDLLVELILSHPTQLQEETLFPLGPEDDAWKVCEFDLEMVDDCGSQLDAKIFSTHLII